MRRTTLALALALTAGVGWTQEEQAAPRPSQDATERVAALEEEVDAFADRWYEEQRALRKQHRDAAERAKEKGEEPPPMPAFPMRPDLAQFTGRLLAWADESSNREDAALYLAYAVELGPLEEGAQGRAALERLAADHAASAQWARLGPLIPHLGRALGAERHDALVTRLLKSPHADVRGWAALARHGATVESAEKGSKEYEAAKRALLAAAAEATDATLKSELEGPIALREQLGVGATAPDIEGVDLDGVAFKLSDYRGQVLLLDFWGDW